MDPGLKAWVSWVRGHNASSGGASAEALPEDITKMRSSELNTALALFVEQLRKPNSSQAYQPDMVYFLILGACNTLFLFIRMLISVGFIQNTG